MSTAALNSDVLSFVCTLVRERSAIEGTRAGSDQGGNHGLPRQAFLQRCAPRKTREICRR